MNIQDIITQASAGHVTLIDVRDHAEVAASGMAQGALHIPLATLAIKADPKSPDYDARISADKPIAIYCAAGGRAGMATQSLGKLGYNAVNIGGFGDWASAGGPISR